MSPRYIRVEKRGVFFFKSGSTFGEQKWSIRKFWTSGKKTTATTACINEWINERRDFYINQSILNAAISAQFMTCQIQVNSSLVHRYTASAVMIWMGIVCTMVGQRSFIQHACIISQQFPNWSHWSGGVKLLCIFGAKRGRGWWGGGG